MWQHSGKKRPDFAVKPQNGQESVWDYPRPPALRRCARRVRVLFDGALLADTVDALCLLETSHPPTYYLPIADIDMQRLRPAAGASYCEWKGEAGYFDLVGDNRQAPRAAWTYPDPTPAYREIVDHIVFYAHAADACYVGDDRALPQPGNFYGGWITPELVGPFKGEPGSGHW